MRRHTFATLFVAAAMLGAGAIPASSVAASHHAKPHTFSFLAKVVRSGPTGLPVKASGGKKLWFPAADDVHHATKPKRPAKHHKGTYKNAARAADTGTSSSKPTVSISVVGLEPGVTVLITETVAANGDITITITLPPSTGSPGAEQTATGVVDEVDDADFYLDPGDGDDLEFNMDADTLSNLNLQTCDTASVTYHQDAGVLIADSVTVTGTSLIGDCAPSDDIDGTITHVSDSGIAIQSDEGPMSFSVDPSSDITDGFSVGDVVDVTYSPETDGTLDATDVEYVEGDDTGVVTAVNAKHLTIADSTTGEPDVFVADPGGLEISSDAFTGITVGDYVDICFHTTAAGLVADEISDSGPNGGSGDSGS